MPVVKTCEHCGLEFSRPPSIAKNARFCSVACRNENSRTAERREIKCERCGDIFITTMDHGRWPQFCSRECFESGSPKPERKICPVCKSDFLAERSSHLTHDGLRIYCSNKCRVEGLKSGVTKECICCGNEFYINQSKLKRSDDHFCSIECKNDYHRRNRSPAWKGGFFVSADRGEKFVVAPGQNGKIKTYVGEHRVIASKVLGRPLTRDEFVIRINRLPSDNRPENLFVCESNSEFSRRRNGSIPWPTSSNLMELAAIQLEITREAANLESEREVSHDDPTH